MVLIDKVCFVYNQNNGIMYELKQNPTEKDVEHMVEIAAARGNEYKAVVLPSNVIFSVYSPIRW